VSEFAHPKRPVSSRPFMFYTSNKVVCSKRVWKLGTRKLAIFAMAILIASVSLSILVSVTPVYAATIQYTLEGLSLSPSITMTTGHLGGWAEGQWVPFRLTITNTDPSNPADAGPVTLQLDYSYDTPPVSTSVFGIDAFASCFSTTAPYCGSGNTPNSGTVWEVLLDSVSTAPDSIINTEVEHSMTHILITFNTFVIPANSIRVITFAVHLAVSGGSNLVCSVGSPDAPCTPTSITYGASYVSGANLHVLNPSGNQDVQIAQVAEVVITTSSGTTFTTTTVPPPIPEYPLGIALLLAPLLGMYILIRRRATRRAKTN
jgi:hypothetical protein